jgi:hypothetical protein
MDETYIKVKGQWRYLYRAVDKTGQTIDFLLTAQRDEEAALRFLKKAIRRHDVPEKITIDGSAANEAAIKRYNEEHGTAIAIRKVKYLNNIIEIVFAQLTKTRHLAARMGGDGADRKNKRPFCASTPGACPLKPPSATGWRPRPRRCPCAPEPGGAPHRAPLLRVDIRRRTGARRAQRCPTQGAGLGTGGLERGLRWDLKHPAAACPQETSSARMAPTSPHATLGA